MSRLSRGDHTSRLQDWKDQVIHLPPQTGIIVAKPRCSSYVCHSFTTEKYSPDSDFLGETSGCFHHHSS